MKKDINYVFDELVDIRPVEGYVGVTVSDMLYGGVVPSGVDDTSFDNDVQDTKQIIGRCTDVFEAFDAGKNLFVPPASSSNETSSV